MSEYSRFYAADSCWGMDMLGKPLGFLAKLMQKDIKQYQKTVDAIKQMLAAGIEVMTSHDTRQ
jgi:hypothetical protein